MNYNEHYSYKIGFELSNIIWKIVRSWDYFSQDTIGKQLVRAIDGISSNIAEGWHRYYKKDKILFFNYSKSSFYESVDFINKAIKRGLIKNEDIQLISNLTKKFPKVINGLIKGVRENLKK
ncbi:MAG TPA: four helix bundle protein [Patescibacteria group bacterium]|nr:four helix bundle protein [Patescibacteria group bacterium]